MTMKKVFWALTLICALLVAGCNRTSTSASRSDAEVASDVQSKINGDSAISSKAITVNSTNGTVTLSGNVANDTERLAASNDASAVPGVKQVVNNLTVGSGSSPIAAVNEPYNPPASTSTNLPSNQNKPSRSSRASSTRGSGKPVTGGASQSSFGANSTSAGSNLGTPATPPAPVTVTVPSGTNLVVYLNDGLSSETANEGDRFSGTLGEPIYVNDQVAVPKNAQVSGRVVSAKGAAKFKGNSELVLELSSLSYGGHNYHINSNQWAKQGAGRGKNTAAKVGGGAALGAIIGGIAGGGKGAAIGAGAGAAAGTGVQAITKGEKIELKPESMLQFTLQAPVTVTPSATENSGRQRLPSPSSDQE
jgi:outer membrane lipoprotein SlyB